MTTDVNNLFTALIRAAEAAIGGDLATTGQGPNQRPAIFRERQKGPKTQYPYMVIDLLSSDTPTQALGREVTEDNLLSYINERVFLFRFRVFANDYRAYNITQNLEKRFSWESIKSPLFLETEGGRIRSLEAINSVPNLLSSSFVESSQVNLIFSIIEKDTDPNSTIIESVEINIDLDRTPDDPEPIEIPITAP